MNKSGLTGNQIDGETAVVLISFLWSTLQTTSKVQAKPKKQKQYPNICLVNLLFIYLFFHFPLPAPPLPSSPKAYNLHDNPQHVIASAYFLNFFCQETQQWIKEREMLLWANLTPRLFCYLFFSINIHNGGGGVALETLYYSSTRDSFFTACLTFSLGTLLCSLRYTQQSYFLIPVFNRQNINCWLGLEKGNWCLVLHGTLAYVWHLINTLLHCYTLLLHHFRFLADSDS